MSLGRARGAAVLGQPLDLQFDVRLDQADEAGSQCFAAEVFLGDTSTDVGRVQVNVYNTPPIVGCARAGAHLLQRERTGCERCIAFTVWPKCLTSIRFSDRLPGGDALGSGADRHSGYNDRSGRIFNSPRAFIGLYGFQRAGISADAVAVRASPGSCRACPSARSGDAGASASPCTAATGARQTQTSCGGPSPIGAACTRGSPCTSA